MHDQEKFLLCYLGLCWILLGSLLLARENPQYYYEAPDGTYNVLLNHVDYENSIVFFVLCESSGSELHGDFKFKEGLIFPPDYWGYLTLRLENNIVIEVIQY